MTIAEFKAWLEGFGEAMSGPPTAEQWATIKTKLGRVNEKPAAVYREGVQPRWL